MAQFLNETVTVDGNTDRIWKPLRKETPPRGTLSVFGTFGGGTVTLRQSPDGGTTFIDVPDSGGTAITFTDTGMTNFELYANGDNIAATKTVIRLALAGSSGASITYVINDAR